MSEALAGAPQGKSRRRSRVLLAGSTLITISLLTPGTAQALTQAPADQATTPTAREELSTLVAKRLAEASTPPVAPASTVKPFIPVGKPLYMVREGKIVPIPLPQAVVGAGTPVLPPPTAANTLGLSGDITSLLKTFVAPAVSPATVAASTVTGPVNFAWPVAQHNLSSPYGMRKHPVLGVVKWHTGSDFSQACGSPIVASLPGTVVSAQMTVGNGNRVVLQHANGLYTTYNHLSAFSVKPGSVVNQGQPVGAVGNTGFSTGCHLHFEVLKEVKPGSIYYTQPMNWLLAKPSGEQAMVGVSSLVKGGTTTTGVTNLSGAVLTADFTGGTYLPQPTTVATLPAVASVKVSGKATARRVASKTKATRLPKRIVKRKVTVAQPVLPKVAPKPVVRTPAPRVKVPTLKPVTTQPVGKPIPVEVPTPVAPKPVVTPVAPKPVVTPVKPTPKVETPAPKATTPTVKPTETVAPSRSEAATPKASPKTIKKFVATKKLPVKDAPATQPVEPPTSVSGE